MVYTLRSSINTKNQCDISREFIFVCVQNQVTHSYLRRRFGAISSEYEHVQNQVKNEPFFMDKSQWIAFSFISSSERGCKLHCDHERLRRTPNMNLSYDFGSTFCFGCSHSQSNSPSFSHFTLHTSISMGIQENSGDVNE